MYDVGSVFGIQVLELHAGRWRDLTGTPLYARQIKALDVRQQTITFAHCYHGCDWVLKLHFGVPLVRTHCT